MVEGALPSILVPAGFETDFASVPRGLWNLFPRDGSYTTAAVVHDCLYGADVARPAAADAVFLEAMKVACQRRITRVCIWA